MTPDEYLHAVAAIRNEATNYGWTNLQPGEEFMAKTSVGNNTWFVTNKGGVYSTAGSQFFGSAFGSGDFVDIKAMPGGAGYTLVKADGTPVSFFAPTRNDGTPTTTNPSPKTPKGQQPQKPPKATPGKNPAHGGADQAENALNALKAMFPWAEKLGLDQVIRQYGTAGLSTDEIIGRLRQTEQYKYQTQGMRRADGTLRFRDENQFFQWRDSMRQVLQRWGQPGYAYDSPEDFLGLAESELLDDKELDQRFAMYDQIKNGSTEIKQAFYVYAGKTLTDDELYEAAVNPDAQVRLTNEYNQRVALQDLDYDTWINRATQFALSDVATKLNDMKRKGIDTGPALDAVRQLNPDFAKQMADAMFKTDGKPMSLMELNEAFQNALIGGAASMNGLDLPSKERLQQFRQAGIDRVKALQAYGQIGGRIGEIQGAGQRAGFGDDVNQTAAEDALLLQSGANAEKFRRAMANEKALGETSGSASFGQDRRSGQITQSGFRRY